MRRFFLVLAVLVFVSGDLSASERILLFRMKGIGVDEELIDAASMLFRGALEEEGKYMPVTAFELLGDVECYEVSCAVSFAKEAGLRRAVTGSLTRLGGKIIVRVQLVDADRGDVEFSDDGVSQTEEDLDVVLGRLAKGLTLGKSMESTAEVGTITEKEFGEVRRRESYSSKSFRVGFLWPTAGSMGGTVRLLVLDLAYQYDTPDFFLMGRSGLRWGGDLDEDNSKALDISFLDAKLGRYLSRGDFSPFFNVGIGIHYVRAVERIPQDSEVYEYDEYSDGATGLAITAGGGFAAFRTYNFQFQIDVDFFIILEKLNSTGQAGGGEYPQGIIFTFCIKKGQKKY